MASGHKRGVPQCGDEEGVVGSGVAGDFGRGGRGGRRGFGNFVPTVGMGRFAEGKEEPDMRGMSASSMSGTEESLSSFVSGGVERLGLSWEGLVRLALSVIFVGVEGGAIRAESVVMRN